MGGLLGAGEQLGWGARWECRSFINRKGDMQGSSLGGGGVNQILKRIEQVKREDAQERGNAIEQESTCRRLLRGTLGKSRTECRLTEGLLTRVGDAGGLKELLLARGPGKKRRIQN